MRFHRWAMRRVETLEEKTEATRRIIYRSSFNRSTPEYLLASINHGRWTIEKSLLRKYLVLEGYNL